MISLRKATILGATGPAGIHSPPGFEAEYRPFAWSLAPPGTSRECSRNWTTHYDRGVSETLDWLRSARSDSYVRDFQNAGS